MQKNTKIISIMVILLVGLGVGYYFGYDHGYEKEKPEIVDENELKIYKNEKYGIKFEYPGGYVLEEGERDTAEGERHYSIVLVKEVDIEPRINGEGPTAITVDIYQNVPKLALLDWLKTKKESNFSLSSATAASTTVSGIDAIKYTWSGLYEGESVAFPHKENVIVISVTSLTAQDENIETYRETLESFEVF